MQDGEQHVGGPLGVIGIYDVTVPFEIAVQPAQKNDGHLHMRVAMRIAHVASLVDQNVVEKAAVSIGCLAQLFGEIREVLNVIPVHLGVAGYILRLIAMMGTSVPRTVETGSGESRARQVLA